MQAASNPRLGLPSASEMARVRRCPGSRALIATLGGRRIGSNSDAEEGTHRHTLIEEGADTDQIEDGNTAYTVERSKALTLEALTVAGMESITVTVEREQRFWLHNERLEKVVSAQLDYLAMARKTALIVDYKTLFGDHGKASANDQIKAQVACLHDTHPELTSIYVGLVQPNLPADRQLTMAHYDMAAIVRAKHEVMAWCSESQAEDAPRIPGKVQCANCDARSLCKEAIAASMAITAVSDDLMLASPDTAAAILERAGQAEAVIKHIKARAKEMLEKDPESIAGYALKPGNEKRTVSDIGKAFSICRDSGVSPAEFQSACTIALGKLEALYVGANPDLPKAAAKRALSELLKESGAITVTQNQPSIVKVTS
jgi:hypothetical protein